MYNSLRKSYADSDIVKKMTQETTLNENISENNLNFRNSANGWKKITIDDHSLKRGFLLKWIVL